MELISLDIADFDSTFWVSEVSATESDGPEADGPIAVFVLFFFTMSWMAAYSSRIYTPLVDTILNLQLKHTDVRWTKLIFRRF